MTRFDGFLIDFQEAFVETMQNMNAGPITIPTFFVCIPRAQNQLVYVFVLVKVQVAINLFCVEESAPFLYVIVFRRKEFSSEGAYDTSRWAAVGVYVLPSRFRSCKMINET